MVNIFGWENEFEEMFVDIFILLLIIIWLKIML